MAFSPKLPDRAQRMCLHTSFEGAVRVDRALDTGQFLARLEIHCANCGLPFTFDPENVKLYSHNTVAKLAITPSVESAAIASIFKA